jgi:hypothetical protein
LLATSQEKYFEKVFWTAITTPLIRLNKEGSASYCLRLTCVDPKRTYRVTLDNSQTTKSYQGAMLKDKGLDISINMNLA